MSRIPAGYLSLAFGLLAILFVAFDLRGTVRIGAQVLLLAPYVIMFLMGRCGGRTRPSAHFFLALLVILVASLVDFLIIDGLPADKLFARSAAFLFLVLCIPALWICAGEDVVMRALRAYSFTALALALGLHLWLVITGQEGVRLSLAHNSNELAMILLAAMPGLLWRMNRFSILAVVLLFHLLLLTTSRASLLGAVVLLLAWLVVERRVRLRMVAGVLTGLVLLMAGMWWIGLPMWQHLTRTHSIMHRLSCWQHGVGMLMQNPLTGTGLGLHGELLRARLGDGGQGVDVPCLHLHNEVFALLADVGVVGSLAWASLVALAVVVMWRRRHEDAISRLALATFAGYATVGMAETMYLRGGHMLWFVAMLLTLRHVLPLAKMAEAERRQFART